MADNFADLRDETYTLMEAVMAPNFTSLSFVECMGGLQLQCQVHRMVGFRPAMFPLACCSKDFQVNLETIARRMQKKGLPITPKSLHMMRKYEIQKAKRRAQKLEQKTGRIKCEIQEDEYAVMSERLLNTWEGSEKAAKEDRFQHGNLSKRKDWPQEWETIFVKEMKEALITSRVGDTAANPGFKDGGGVQEVADSSNDEGTSNESHLVPGRSEFNRHNVNEMRQKEYEIKEEDYLEANGTSNMSDSCDEESVDLNGYTSLREDRRLEKPRLRGRQLQDFRRRLLLRRKGDLRLFMEDDEDDSNHFEQHDDGLDPEAHEQRQLHWLANRLNMADKWFKHVHFSRLMHGGRLKLTEGRVLKLVQMLGEFGNWQRAMEVVHWVHNRERYQDCKSRYVYTMLLAVLGKARKPVEALNVFNVMRESLSTYPDMAAYHSIAVTLGQAGSLQKLLDIMESLKLGPDKIVGDIKLLKDYGKLFPDIVIYNAVINACVPHKDWARTIWVLEQLKVDSVSPNSATYGLAIEVMAKAEKFELACKIYKKMESGHFLPDCHTYRALVEACAGAGELDLAIQLVEEMEKRGIVASASVYYALACCYCMVGRWQDALAQMVKIAEFPSKKPDVVTYNGLIKACAKAGYWRDSALLFKKMHQVCAPTIGTYNLMIGIYGRNKQFEEAKALFEVSKKGGILSQKQRMESAKLSPDAFTYEIMLGACAATSQWDHFENVYKEMLLRGYKLCPRRHHWIYRILFSGKLRAQFEKERVEMREHCTAADIKIFENAC